MIKYELLKGKNILIIVKISDGLGNQMFQYAYAKTLQMNLPHKVYLDISDINNYRNNSLNNIKWRKLCDKRNYQLDHFLITLPIIDEEKVNKILKKRNEYGRFLNYCEELRMSPTVYFKESECRETGIKYTRYQNYQQLNLCHTSQGLSTNSSVMLQIVQNIVMESRYPSVFL